MAEPQDIRRAYDLIAEGRADAALELTAALNVGPVPSEAALSVHAVALKAARRPTEALAVNRTAAQRYPASRVAWHNLAATLGDLGQAQEAEASARKAMALGLGAPETRLVLARALQAQQRFDEAQAAFAEAIALRPDFNDAHRDLAQLIWMRTADRTAALAGLRQAVADHPANLFLRFILATAQEFTGDKPGARATLEEALQVDPQDRTLLSLMVRLCCETGEAAAALTWARSVARMAQDPGADVMLAQALLASGDPAGAEAAAARAAVAMPTDQSVLAMLATAWRMLGDPRYGVIYDYDRLVGVYDIAAEDDLEALRAALHRLHGFTTHPFSQSVRFGSQAPLRLDGGHEAPIEAMLGRFRQAVADHIAGLTPGGDPFTALSTGKAELSGAWSVRLGAAGHHTNHVHSLGWLSSVFYVALPQETKDSATRAGWLKFGEPGVATEPALAPEHYVEPRAGRLVLFPSYMWHGT
ncbi:putative 2OG-Fe(II) oxygenase, partial [Phenylobacterium sp.]|uniref:putative 2OG-Fe(II) oxygenase n=1 Tax=Phenylobacterium sp. TaxID=1871053 RepID=UPI003983149A